MEGGDNSPAISVAVGVTVGLLASFVQSLGLTIQRKSHLQNESLPASQRKKDHNRPLWLTGFSIFICSNILGTIFQIGALPMIVLGPLGAVSLLYNAFFARLILGDKFSIHLIVGTFLIAGGAVLIGIFGVVPEQTHTLDELILLYSRPAFIIWISLLSLALAAILTAAHITEWAFERRLNNNNNSNSHSNSNTKDPLDSSVISSNSTNLTPVKTLWRKRNRRYSTPGRPIHFHHSNSSPVIGSVKLYGSTNITTNTTANGIATTVEDGTSESQVMRRAGSVIPTVRVYDTFSPPPPSSTTMTESPRISATDEDNHSNNNNGLGIRNKVLRLYHDDESTILSDRANDNVHQEHHLDLEGENCTSSIERTRLILGVAYGSASGTLSGLCLLFAKTGVELLILTVVGQNQFGRFQAWLIVFVLLIAAVLQLYYLNRALRLVGPTLICPLAFCLYNLSSMVSGLVYYNQVDMLSSLQLGIVTLGTAILLTGVWIVSIKTDDGTGEIKLLDIDVVGGEEGGEGGMGICGESESESEDESDVEDDWIPRGLTIGIGAISPGFEIRPAGNRRAPPHSPLRPSSATLPSHSHPIIPNEEHSPLFTTNNEFRDGEEFDFSANNTPSSSTILEGGGNSVHKKRRERGRGFSISGSLYVGSTSRRNSTDFTGLTPLPLPLSPDVGRSTDLV